ncbi:hypothetical protein [Paenibacillus radicis (ex Xue et al. 2023)]|uniref:Uncharacterized protein n=1 Tax=Paenibacillus radicis (ex Xue et al. 2023) TaxID=2972489 RepID=A0ABT1YH96_9BACL|nr:hypothetical protein [Paenibacillus radicis (ex Xue et al. 2023)]MCR8632558.1 hypothetical protein [Paenibacillus radicis (ex Xue et al. 2023)]
MILYQMAKRMEQREQLKHSIEQTGGGNTEHLVSQKEMVEEQLLTQTNRWAEEGSDEFMLGAMTPEAVVPQENLSWL